MTTSQRWNANLLSCRPVAYLLPVPDREHVFDEAGRFLNPYDRFRHAPALGADLGEGRLVLLGDLRFADNGWRLVTDLGEKLQPRPSGVSQRFIAGGYGKQRAAGIITSSGAIDIVIPPSIAISRTASRITQMCRRR